MHQSLENFKNVELNFEMYVTNYYNNNLQQEFHRHSSLYYIRLTKFSDTFHSKIKVNNMIGLDYNKITCGPLDI